MPRKKNGSRGNGKAIIRVFCEGESEQAYTEFLKKRFADVAVMKYPRETGLFDAADSRFAKDPLYRDYAEVIDEIWFFFDVEAKDIGKWDQRMKIVKRLRKLRRKPAIKVRLLMTTGCIEYWLMLHDKMYTPSLRTVAEKERVISDLLARFPTYRKGDYDATAAIAVNYPVAAVHARKTVERLLSEGMPGIEDSDERNQWLCQKCMTFSTVYEAIEFLEGKSRR